MTDESLHFERAAGYYDATRGYPPGVEAGVADALRRAGRLDESSDVLEVGVGTGRIALPLARHVRSVAGVDLARPMLARLRDKRRDEPVLPVVARATALPFPAARFDAVVGVHIFHLIADWRGALAEVRRVLRPGGRLLAGSDDYLLRDVWQAVNAVVPRPPNVGVKDMRGDFLPETGFAPVGEPVVTSYVQRVELPAFLDQIERRVWSSLWRLDDAAHARMVELMRQELQTRFGSLEATLEVPRSFTARSYTPVV